MLYQVISPLLGVRATFDEHNNKTTNGDSVCRGPNYICTTLSGETCVVCKSEYKSK